jgi:hypothetical protein
MYIKYTNGIKYQEKYQYIKGKLNVLIEYISEIYVRKLN